MYFMALQKRYVNEVYDNKGGVKQNETIFHWVVANVSQNKHQQVKTEGASTIFFIIL